MWWGHTMFVLITWPAVCTIAVNCPYNHQTSDSQVIDWLIDGQIYEAEYSFFSPSLSSGSLRLQAGGCTDYWPWLYIDLNTSGWLIRIVSGQSVTETTLYRNKIHHFTWVLVGEKHHSTPWHETASHSVLQIRNLFHGTVWTNFLALQCLVKCVFPYVCIREALSNVHIILVMFVTSCLCHFS